MSEKYIGIWVQDGSQLLCFNCAYYGDVEGLVFTQGAYPDGYTCFDCGKSIADQDYKEEVTN